MSERTDLNIKGEAILDFADVYDVLKYEHVEKFFPYSKQILNYLINKRRLHKSPNGIYIGTDRYFCPDKCLLAALSVLADIFEKVKSHARATAPVQIPFVTYSGDYYGIVYVGYGMEVMITASFNAQLAAMQRSREYRDYADTTKRMVIVEDKSQMTRLQIPGITHFALVQPDGSLSYFKGS